MHTTRARRLSGALIVLILALTAAGSLRAAPSPWPSVTPVVNGTVRDSAGAPLANVRVIVRALNRVATTNGQGRFAFRGLPAGRHHLTAILIGYAPAHADVVVPDTGSEITIEIVMHFSPVRLSGVQVTATSMGNDPRDVPQALSELSAQALSRQLTSSVAQTLANEPGISVRYSGPAASAPVIRGLSGERILVLQDGDRTGDLSSSSPDHGQSIDPLVAERIEVVRGPASLLYGNSALGGVVNVISNDIPSSIPTHLEGYAAGQAESVTPGGGVAAGITIPVSSSFALVARGGARNVDDVRQGKNVRLANSYYRNLYGVGGFGIANDLLSGGAVYRGYRFDYGLPAADGDSPHIEGERHEIAARSEIALGGPSLPSLRVSGTAQWYQHDEIEPDGAIGTRFNLRTQTLDLLGRTKFSATSGAFGASGLLKQYAAFGEEALTPAANSSGAGFFLFQEFPLRAQREHDDRVPRLQVGARYDVYRIASQAGEAKFGTPRTITFNNPSGSIGVTLPFGEVVSLGVSAARAFRAPTVEELFSNAFHHAVGTYDRGNPSLESEVNNGVDAVLRIDGLRVHGQLAGYVSSIDHYITPDIVKDTLIEGEDGPITVPLNQFRQADATLRGFEGRLEVETVRHLVVGTMADMVRGSFRDDDEPLPYIPAARWGGLMRWDDGGKSASVEYRHVFRQNRVPEAAIPDDPTATPTDDYDLVDLSLGLNIAAGERVNSILLRVDNLFDVQYADATSRIKNFAFNPGRNVSLVYKILF